MVHALERTVVMYVKFQVAFQVAFQVGIIALILDGQGTGNDTTSCEHIPRLYSRHLVGRYLPYLRLFLISTSVPEPLMSQDSANIS